MAIESSQGLHYFISGANRGIGLELVYNILKRQPDAVIFAGARDPSSAKELKELASENPNVHLIKVIADDEESNKQAVEKIKKVTDRLDVVVANAGIASGPQAVQTVDTSAYRRQFEVNTLGPLFIYKATYPLLMETRENKSGLPAPKFFITSSALGSKGGFFPEFITAPYGMSKAAVNYLALSIHHQSEKVGAVVVPYHPGVVTTDMNADLDLSEYPGAITPEQSGAEYADLIIKATRGEQGGKFWGQGSERPLPW